MIGSLFSGMCSMHLFLREGEEMSDNATSNRRTYRSRPQPTMKKRLVATVRLTVSVEVELEEPDSTLTFQSVCTNAENKALNRLKEAMKDDSMRWLAGSVVEIRREEEE